MKRKFKCKECGKTLICGAVLGVGIPNGLFCNDDCYAKFLSNVDAEEAEAAEKWYLDNFAND